LEWVTNRNGRDLSSPVTWQFVLGEPRLKRSGNSLQDRFAAPTYYGSPARALAGYLEIRTRRAQSLAEVPAICETAIRSAHICRADASPGLATVGSGPETTEVMGV